MPWSSDGDTSNDENGTGATSTGASSRAEYVGGGGMRRPPLGREPPDADGPRRRRWAVGRDDGEAKTNVRGSHPIARHHFYAEPPHAATQLGKHLVAGIALHTVEATAVHRDDGTLDVD